MTALPAPQSAAVVSFRNDITYETCSRDPTPTLVHTHTWITSTQDNTAKLVRKPFRLTAQSVEGRLLFGKRQPWKASLPSSFSDTELFFNLNDLKWSNNFLLRMVRRQVPNETLICQVFFFPFFFNSRTSPFLVNRKSTQLQHNARWWQDAVKEHRCRAPAGLSKACTGNFTFSRKRCLSDYYKLFSLYLALWNAKETPRQI